MTQQVAAAPTAAAPRAAIATSERERAQVAVAPTTDRRGRRRENSHASGRSSPATREQREHRRAGAPARRRLDEQRAEHEQQVRDVDVGARAEGEHGHAREEDRAASARRGGPNQSRAERVDDPAERAEREEREHDRQRGRLLDAPSAAASGDEHDARAASASGCGVGAIATSRSGVRPVRELAAPRRARRACRS